MDDRDRRADRRARRRSRDDPVDATTKAARDVVPDASSRASALDVPGGDAVRTDDAATDAKAPRLDEACAHPSSTDVPHAGEAGTGAFDRDSRGSGESATDDPGSDGVAAPFEPADDTPPRLADAVGRTLRRLADDAAAQDWPAAALYVVATPIGNRADITVRALACLARVDAVAAEDTRVARTLLRHYGIDRPMLAAHRHNEEAAAAAVVARLAAGERVAYVSDAGTPGVSDPGARLVAAARRAGFRVVPIGGVSALTTAWSAAGLADGPVHFVGFLPSRAAQATAALKSLATIDAHLVFYEAPHRIAETLAAIGAVFGGRHCIVARELTKRFEAIHRGRTDEATAWLAEDPQRARGEFVVIVEAAVADGDDVEADRDLARAGPILDRLLRALSVSEASSLAAELTGVSRKVLYAEALRRRSNETVEPDAHDDDR